MTNPALDIRIGTLVKGDSDPAGYIRQIVPHGFESFQITFWRTLGDVDLPRMADGVRAALDGHDAVISSVGIYGNPLENDPLEDDPLESDGVDCAVEKRFASSAAAIADGDLIVDWPAASAELSSIGPISPPVRTNASTIRSRLRPGMSCIT